MDCPLLPHLPLAGVSMTSSVTLAGNQFGGTTPPCPVDGSSKRLSLPPLPKLIQITFCLEWAALLPAVRLLPTPTPAEPRASQGPCPRGTLPSLDLLVHNTKCWGCSPQDSFRATTPDYSGMSESPRPESHLHAMIKFCGFGHLISGDWCSVIDSSRDLLSRAAAQVTHLLSGCL